ncbi:MAG TPA: hypothetical protein VFV01_13770 [Spirillospora sp.]|nr:hypothetical protein [Spirillospora sp.]
MLTALNNTLTSDDGLILTCRTEQYISAVDAFGGDVLPSGAVIEPTPVAPAAAAAYLTACRPPRSSGGWPVVIAALRDHADTPLTRALTTPLTLWLVRKVYIDGGKDPSGLADPDRFPTPDAITEHLLSHLIDAIVATDPRWRSPGPAEVRRRLGLLAAHMHARGSRDLVWWQLCQAVPTAGTRAVSLLPLLTVTVLTGLVPIMASVLRGEDPEDGLAFTSLFMMAVSGFLGLVGRRRIDGQASAPPGTGTGLGRAEVSWAHRLDHARLGDQRRGGRRRRHQDR